MSLFINNNIAGLGVSPQKYFEYINNSLQLARKYARIFVRGRYLFRVANSLSYVEQVMSKDKYPSIFSPQMEAIVFIMLKNLFRNSCSFENWGIYKQQPPFCAKIC